MEALPTVPMLAPQFRTSTLTYDNIVKFDFKTKVKEYILLHFQADPHAYDQAFRELSDMKHEANNPTETVESACSLKRYFGQLCMLQKRFPMAPDQELSTPFAWFDSLCDNRHPTSDVTHNDIEFEKASVMFNIGAVHAQIAALESRGDQDSIKHAFMHFQYAAYAFERLKNERYEDIFYPSVDLDPQVVSFFEKLMLAQAQECLVQKSLLDNRTPIVIGKLAFWLYQVYAEMIHKCGDWSVNIAERIQRVYIGICQLKMNMYACISFMSMGDNAETQTNGMGHRLQYYNIALKFMKNIISVKGLTEHHPEFLPSIGFLNDVVTAKQMNAEKENNFIYHERIPKEEDLIQEMQNSGLMCKAKSLAFNPLDRSVCGDDIFGTLLPPTVLKSVSVYEEMKADLKRKIMTQVDNADVQLESFLNKAGYTDLRWMLSDDKKDNESLFVLPDMLLERNAELTAKPDSIPVLLERLRESAETSRVAEAKLNTLIEKLRAIDLPRLKNDEGYTLILKELEKLHEHLTNAKSNNVSLNKAIAAHSSNLQILSLPIIELRQKLLPKMKETKTKSKEEQHLKRVMNKIEEMRSQRAKLLTQFEVEIEQDDISKELLAERDFSHDDIFEKELAKHDETIKYLGLNVTAQMKILHAFTEANADFCDERMVINSENEEFNKQVLILVAAYDIYKDVCMKVADGEKFYRQLMQRCDQFAVPIHAIEEQYRVEVEKREREKREIDEHRRMREARSSLNEFAAPQPVYSSGPPPAIDAGHPRLRDYMDQYRNRSKLAPVQTDHQSEHLPGPPSPTPSSINEFPISPSVRGSRVRDTPILSHHSPVAQNYSTRPTATPGYSHHPNSMFHAPYQPAPYRSNSIQSSGSTSSLGSLANPQQNYSQQQPQYPYSQYQYQPQSVVPPAHQPATPIQGSAQFVAQNFGQPMSQPAGVPSQFNGPPFHPSQQPASGIEQAPAPIPQQFQPPVSTMPPPTPVYQGAAVSQQSQPPNDNHSYTTPVSTMSGNTTSPYQEAHQPTTPIQNFGQPMSQSAVIPNQFNSSPFIPPQQPSSGIAQAPAPVPQQFQPPVSTMPASTPVYQGAVISQQSQLPNDIHPYTTPIPTVPGNTTLPYQEPSKQFQQAATGLPFQQPVQTSPQLQATNTSIPQFQKGPSQLPAQQFQPASITTSTPGYHATGQQFQQPAMQQFTASKPSTPSFQNGPPQVSTQQFQPTATGSPFQQPSQTPQQFQASKTSNSPFQKELSPVQQFQPTSPAVAHQFAAPSFQKGQVPLNTQQGTSSPWHQSPAQLQTSAWHHAQQQQHQQQQQQQQQPPKPSNVDLLSDLLGDFNLQQPALQPVQHQKQPNPDFRLNPLPAAPDKKVAAVLPMPQPVHKQICPIDQPILSMNVASSVSFHSQPTPPTNPLPINDLTDPNKFEIGAGNTQKLEKRLLHQSIRSNGPLPPLDPSDPLNQIDAFGNVPR